MTNVSNTYFLRTSMKCVFHFVSVTFDGSAAGTNFSTIVTFVGANLSFATWCALGMVLLKLVFSVSIESAMARRTLSVSAISLAIRSVVGDVQHESVIR